MKGIIHQWTLNSCKIKQKHIQIKLSSQTNIVLLFDHILLTKISFAVVIIMIIIIVLLFTFFSLDSFRANISLDALLSRFSWRSHNSSRSLFSLNSFGPSLSRKTTSSYWSGGPCLTNPVWTLTNISFYNRSHVSLGSLSNVTVANRFIAVDCIHAATNNWNFVSDRWNKQNEIID